MSHTLPLASEDFDAFIGDSSLSLVDFWAPWCTPCRQLQPTIDAIGSEFPDRLRVAKVDVDQAPELVFQYGIRGIPTLILFREGKALAARAGLQSKESLTRWIEDHL